MYTCLASLVRVIPAENIPTALLAERGSTDRSVWTECLVKEHYSQSWWSTKCTGGG